MKPSTALTKHRAAVDDWLQAYILTEADDTPYGQLRAQAAELIEQGGKRLRPGLCLLAYEGYHGKDLASAVPVAAAIELLHSYFLIHDDIIDRNTVRHGGPNITGQYLKRLNETIPPYEASHNANAMALLAGDVCRALAYQAIADADVSAETECQLQRLFLAAEQSTLHGETDDVGFGLTHTPPSVAIVLQMYAQKTAGYSFALPLQAGALLAGADAGELKLLASLGNTVGLAYQLRDDLIDIFSDDASLGKPAGSDIREGKLTVPILLTQQNAAPEDAKRLATLLHNHSLDAAVLNTARDIIERSGARQTTQQYIDRYSRQARGVLAMTNLSSEAKSELTDCLQTLIKRQY